MGDMPNKQKKKKANRDVKAILMQFAWGSLHIRHGADFIRTKQLMSYSVAIINNVLARRQRGSPKGGGCEHGVPRLGPVSW